MAKAKSRPPMVAFVLRLPAALHQQVTRMARRDNRSLNSEIQVALRHYLNHRKETTLHGQA